MGRPSPLAALLAKSPALQQLLADAPVQVSTPDPPRARIFNPSGPRQRKRQQRRRLFDALRRGAGREAACEAAGITTDTLEDWCEQQPSFREAVLQAMDFRLPDEDEDDDW